MLYLIQRSVFLARLDFHRAGTGNVCAARRGIGITIRKISYTINSDISILISATDTLRRRGIRKIDIRRVRCAAVGGAFTLTARTGRQLPFVIVKDKDAVAAAQRTRSAFINNELRAGLQENILRHIDLASAMHPNGHIAVNGQNVVRRIDRLAT